MNNNIQCSIESSTASINLNSAEDGIYLTPELEGLAGLPEIRTSSGVNAGYDGGWTSAQNYDARLITLRGVIANPDISLVEQKRRQLASIVGQGRKESLTLHFTTEAGRAYTCDVRTISCEMALQRALTKQDFIIQLRADNPLIYDDSGGSTAGIINVQKELGGFEIDFELPLVIGGGTDISTIVNEGETSNPTIVLNGALHSPTIVNQTTNQQMQILADLEQTPIYSDQISASGNPISFDIDTEYGGKIEELKLNGNAEQTTYSGKNKIDGANPTDANLATTSLSDNVVTVSSTATNTTPYARWVVDNLSANDVVRCSSVIMDSNGQIALQYDNNGSWATITGSVRQYTDGTTPATYSWTNTVNTTKVRFLLYANKVIPTGNSSSRYKNAILTINNSDMSYEPYVGGTASPNPDYPQDINVVTGAQTVSVTGKNLLSADDGTYTNNGITGVVSNGELTLNGTATAISSAKLGTYMLIPAGTYTLSANNTSSETGTSLLRLIDINGNAPTVRACSLNSANATKTFTLATDTWLAYQWRFDSGKTLTNFTIKPQLELGNSASSYEPYQGQSYEVNLGKNLFDSTQTTVGSINVDGSVNTSATTYNTTDYIPINGGTTYTTSGMSASGYNPSRCYYDSAKNFISGVRHNNATPFINTAPANAFYMRDCFLVADIDSIQIEAGQATTYAPYFTPIELAKIGTYQDYIWNDGGTWKVHKAVDKVVVDGSTTLTQLQASTNTTRVVATISSEYGAPLSTVQLPLCDYFVGTSSVWATDDIQGTYIQSRYVVLRANNTTVGATLDSFKTWLSTHPTTVYYALATPTDTEITEQALIDQLNAVANAQLYSGENNIMNIAFSPNLAGDLEIGYVEMEGYDRDQIIIDSQNQTVTMNGENIYDKIADGSEFITMASGDNKMFLTSEVTSDTGYAEVKFKQGFISI